MRFLNSYFFTATVGWLLAVFLVGKILEIW